MGWPPRGAAARQLRVPPDQGQPTKLDVRVSATANTAPHTYCSPDPGLPNSSRLFQGPLLDMACSPGSPAMARA